MKALQSPRPLRIFLSLVGALLLTRSMFMEFFSPTVLVCNPCDASAFLRYTDLNSYQLRTPDMVIAMSDCEMTGSEGAVFKRLHIGDGFEKIASDSHRKVLREPFAHNGSTPLVGTVGVFASKPTVALYLGKLCDSTRR